MFGWGKREKPVESVEVFQVDEEEGTMEEVWGVDMSQVEGSWETVCAWCLAEQGRTPDPADSHGICEYHRTNVLQAYHERDSR